MDASGGHRENQTKLPDPTSGWRLWAVGSWALPAVTLSFASAAVFAVVLYYLQHDRQMRSLFVLPWYTGAAIALLAATTSWMVVRQGSRRPGRIGPRLWALALLLVSSLAVILVCVWPRSSWTHALAVAALAAAVTLLARLVKVRPDSSLVQRIAPLSLLAVLVVVVPSARLTGRHIVDGKRARISGLIDHLRWCRAEVEAVASHPWDDMADHPDAAAQAVVRLRAVSVAHLLDAPELWSDAAVLGLDGELGGRAEELGDAVVDAIATGRAPGVSSFPEPALYWNHSEGRWQKSKDFPGLSATVGDYHREIGRLVDELAVADLAIASEPYRRLVAHHRAANNRFANTAKRKAASWSDGWAAVVLPQHRAVLGKDSIALVDLFQLPLLAPAAPESLAAADLGSLARLPLGTARQLAAESADCKLLPYVEPPKTYFRVDCYAYEPAPNTSGAQLRIELRVVYESNAYQPLVESASPVELFFLVPIPPETESDAFGAAVMTSLATAARKRTSGTVVPSDRGNSRVSGFNIFESGASTKVLHPTVTSLVGDDRALQVRAMNASRGQ
ncbi:MAG TPA: hypothetical protein VFS60_00900 [Thermoanaerobaculia bacterium]|nr:hypothetical protein [Thermoanaerobaculia bacterium]